MNVNEDQKPRRRREPITIVLDTPVEFGSKQITEITIRPVKGKFLRRITTEVEPARTMQLAAMMSGQDLKVIDELEGDDLFAVLEAVNLFFVSSPPTGDEP